MYISELVYDNYYSGVVLLGGIIIMVYNFIINMVEWEFISFVGMVRNCLGGIMFWGMWLMCEEFVDWFYGLNGDVVSKDYGYIFEVFVNVDLFIEVKLFKVMGCFNYEVVCVDFKIGIVYLIED